MSCLDMNSLYLCVRILYSYSDCYSKYRGGAVQGGLEVPGFMTSFMSDSSRRRADEQSTLEAIDYLAPAEQKKKQALSIILMELTRLRKVNAEQDSSQKYLSDTVKCFKLC